MVELVTSPVPTAPTLGQVMAAMEALYPARLAEDWDAVGLVCGDPDRPVRSVLVAIDPVAAVVDEALALGADLLITHHPLFLRGVHGVATTSAAGRAVTRLIEGGCALLAAHTNADAARPGVADALAGALGLVDLRPLQRVPESDPMRLLVIYVPPEHVDAVLDAAAASGAGEVGDYRRCAFTSPGIGTYDSPVDGAPFIGRPGQRGSAAEVRIEMTVPNRDVSRVVAGVLASHPYEEPAYEVVPLVDSPRTTGIGRVGRLPEPLPLAQFARLVAEKLPATAHGVRVAGDPAVEVASVAVCGGSGDSLLPDAVAAGVDAYVTADLRHHRVSDHLADGGCALLDVAHWASEWPWCPQVAEALPAAVAAVAGVDAATVDITVSRIPTDPWTMHVRSV